MIRAGDRRTLALGPPPIEAFLAQKAKGTVWGARSLWIQDELILGAAPRFVLAAVGGIRQKQGGKKCLGAGRC